MNERFSIVSLTPKKPHPWPDLETLRQLDEGYVDTEINESFQVLGQLYAHYARSVKKLDEIWDKELQPQKGLAIKRLLDAAVCRLLELKELLCQIDISEYHYVDGAIIQLKLVPNDFEIWELQGVPPSRDQKIQEKINKLYIGEKIWEPPPPPRVEEEEEEAEEEQEQEENVEDPMLGRRKRKIVQQSSEEKIALRPVVVQVDPKVLAFRAAILLIQKHERARQGRLEFLDEKTQWDFRHAMKRYKPPKQEITVPAAKTIQRYYRGYIARRNLARKEEERRLMIGMHIPYLISAEEKENALAATKLKRDMREQKLKEYIETIKRERDRIVHFVSPGLAEDIQDEIRYWFRSFYDVAGCFDAYPPPQVGGTVIVIRGETVSPEEYLLDQDKRKKEQDALKANPELAAKMKAEADKAKKQEREKQKKDAERARKEAAAQKKKKKSDGPFTMKRTEVMKKLEEAGMEYGDNWIDQWEKEENPNREIAMETITSDICYEVQLQVRKEMDNLMRLELVLLQKALGKDTGKKWKAAKQKKEKKKKKKKEPKGGAGYMDGKIEEAFQDLYENGIIRQYPEVSTKDFIGEYSYANSDFRFRRGPPLDPQPTTGEARQLVWNTCILPLGVSSGNLTKDQKPRSVAIVGPRQTGKKQLVYAVCNETNAVLFDLTPSNLSGKYQDKQQKKDFIQKLISLSHFLQPSVIFLDGAEKPFYKKVPKPQKQDNPKSVKKILAPIIKKILPTDQIMIIATTKAPKAAKQKPFIKFFDRIILVPRPDYGTVFRVWQDILMKYKNVPRNFDVSSLTQLTLGYPIPEIRNIVQAVITPKRLVTMTHTPFQAKEIIEEIVKGSGIAPITVQENNEIVNWYNEKVPMGKRRAERVVEEEQQRLLEDMQTAKDAKRKKTEK